MAIPKPTFKEIYGAVPKPTLNEKGTLRFSFKYAQIPGSDPFCISELESSYFHKLLERLVLLSSTKTDEFARRTLPELKNHAVDFKRDRVSKRGFDFMIDDVRQEAEDSAYQFSVTRNSHGRIIGFLIDDLFYVVWCDHSHQLYPGNR